jgi:ribosome maturation factor RimP
MQNKVYIWLNDKIEKKNQFSKRIKKIKRIKIKINIKIKTISWSKNEIKKK